MKNNIVHVSLIVIGFLVGASALVVMAQTGGTWTAPTAPPPNDNTPAPINVGSGAQAKVGLLGLKSLQYLPGIAGSVTAGQVLTATDANGTVAWQTAGSAAIPNFSVYNFPGPFTFNVPAGVTKIQVEAWGGGGNATTYSSGSGKADAGGGGGYAKASIAVTGGSTCSIVVATAGNNSTVTCGSASVTANGGSAPNGGSASSSGTTAFLSITGGRGVTVQSPSSVGEGGDSPQGGQGGTGTGSIPGCSNGIAPGGGGAAVGNSPCNGAVGRVVISY